jgi:hypothetical protein
LERRYIMPVNGQQLVQADLNLLGETSALADDRVLAELFRMRPYDGATHRAVIPFHVEGAGNESIVCPNGTTGTVKVNPFRAVIGSRTPVGTNAKDNYRDIRSTICVGASTLAQTATFAAAPSAGNARWDLVYASVTVDANGPTITRKVKNPTSGIVTGTPIPQYRHTTVSLGVVTGTPATAGDALFPAAPADSGSTYVIPLAYVLIRDTYGPSFEFKGIRIMNVAPVLSLSRATGAVSARPATGQHALSIDMQGEMSDIGGINATTFMPTSMVGAETLYVALDFSSGSELFHSHTQGDVIDSGDWRGRICFWSAVTGLASDDARFPWEPFVGDPEMILFNANPILYDFNVTRTTVGAGQTILPGFTGWTPGDTLSPPMALAASLHTAFSPLAASIAIYCDHTDGGKLKLWKNAGALPAGRVFFELRFSAPFGSRTHE